MKQVPGDQGLPRPDFLPAKVCMLFTKSLVFTSPRVVAILLSAKFFSTLSWIDSTASSISASFSLRSFSFTLVVICTLIEPELQRQMTLSVFSCHFHHQIYNMDLSYLDQSNVGFRDFREVNRCKDLFCPPPHTQNNDRYYYSVEKVTPGHSISTPLHEVKWPLTKNIDPHRKTIPHSAYQ